MDSERIGLLERRLTKLNTLIDTLSMRINNCEGNTTKILLQVEVSKI